MIKLCILIIFRQDIIHEIYENKIHILIYLDGLFNETRLDLFQYQCAPIQVNII